MLRTRLSSLLGVDYPIISAPMALHSDGSLAAAVSLGGGLGTFGAAGPLVGPEFVREQINTIRARTDRPFGVGFLTHLLEVDRENFDLVISEKVPVIAFSFADPRPWIGIAKKSEATVICQVHTVEAARAAASAGADVLVAQGNEAGGHAGQRNLLPFLCPLIEEFPGIPIVAAGGIASGRSLAAVLGAGAEGAWMGTAFLATNEAPISHELKDLIVRSTAEDTVYTPLFDRFFELTRGAQSWPDEIAARVYKSSFARKWVGRERELESHLSEVASDMESRPNPLAFFGESASFIHQIQSAENVVRSICSDAAKLLSERARNIS